MLPSALAKIFFRFQKEREQTRNRVETEKFQFIMGQRNHCRDQYFASRASNIYEFEWYCG